MRATVMRAFLWLSNAILISHAGERPVNDNATTKAAQELDPAELRELIAEGVYLGVAKAIGVYLLVSAVVGLVIWMIAISGEAP